MRIKLARVQTDKKEERNKTEISVIKNKCASPWGVATVFIDWGRGYDRKNEVIDWAVEFNMITAAGSWYTLVKGDKEKCARLDVVSFFSRDRRK